MHRLALFLVLCSCSAAQYPGGARLARAELPNQAAPAEPKLVVAGSVEVASRDVDGLVHAVRARIHEAHGHVLDEEVSGTARDAPRATLRVRLPPPEVPPFADWLAAHSEVLARHLGAQDVSRAYLDEELALHNLHTTMARLESLAAQGGNLGEVLEIERELNRVRGEIERLEGAHRGLGDQAALATLDVAISPADEALAPRAMFQLVPSASLLALVDARGRQAVRAGGGVSLMFGRHGSLELQLFRAQSAQPRSALLTFHTDAYSDFLGGGRRRFLNPYLGLLAGGGSLDGQGTFTAGVELGVELYRGPRLLVDLGARAQALLYGDNGPPSDLAVQVALGAGVPF